MSNDAISMKSIRLYFGLTCAEMAGKLGVSESTIRMIESSYRPLSSKNKLKLGQIFDLNDEVIEMIRRSKEANKLLSD